MTVRRPFLAAVLAGLVVLAVLAVVGTGRGGSPRSDEPLRTPARAGTSGPSATPSPGRPSTAPSAPEASGPATDGRSGQPALEVPADAFTSPALPGLGRAARLRRASEAELREPFPALQIRRDELAPRHPRLTVAVPRAADVQSSSLSTEDGITQVGLVLRVPGSVDRALRFYRIRLGRIGFTQVEKPSVATGDAAAFQRRPDTVVVTVRRAGRDAEVTVYATLRTGG